MWKMVYASVQGTSHARNGQLCQDCSFACTSRPASETFLVIACADGAGCASHSQLGASLACERITRLVFDSLQSGLEPTCIDLSILQRWIAETRSALNAEALNQGLS